MTTNTKSFLVAVGIIVADIAVVGGLCMKYWQQVFPVFDFVLSLNLIVVVPLTCVVCYKIDTYKPKPPKNECLLRRLRREAFELYSMEFFVDIHGEDIYNVGYRSKVKSWYEGGLYYFNNKENAIESLNWLRRQYVYDTIARMRADRREKQIREEIRKL